MPLQNLPPSASDYSRTQRREIAAAVAATRRIWSRMGEDFDLSFLRITPSLLAVTTTAQERVAAGAQAYIPAVLEDTGQTRAVRPVAEVSTRPLIGVAGDGRPVEGLLYGAVTRAKTQVAQGLTARQALASSGQWMSMAVGTLLSDTGRASERLGTAVRPVSGYVRMLNPPSCSRCAILAGRYYPSSSAFQRHPGCDCRHIPASESVAADLTVDPAAYFDSLSAAEQERIFTKAGAEAIREGANVGQVVNARRGMSYAGKTNTTSREMLVRKPDGSLVMEARTVNVTRRTAQTSRIGGQDVLTSTEGTTRRGLAYRPGRPRLMPETLSAIATDKADYLRLLKANGYVL